MLRKLIKKLSFGNTLYYPGCLTKFVLKDIQKNYEKILVQLGIDFIVLRDLEVCCGSPAKNAGYISDFDDLTDKNRIIFRQHNISRIITNCPACYHFLKKSFEDIEVEHISQTIWGNIEKLKLKSFNEPVHYHDPCHLSRHSNIPNAYDEPRLILKALDFEIVEFPKIKDLTQCCGAGAGLKTNAPKLSSRIAKLRLKDAKYNIITSCPLCYLHLKENYNKEVFELSQVLV